MAMELKHLNPQHVMDVTGNAIDEISRLRAENAELKQKLESVQASMYTDVVDACMENRRLKRALYKACTNWAFAMDDLLTNKILDGNHSDKLRFTRDRWWRMGHKCLNKEEEYK